MKKIAIYGKGGIGKSTITSSLSAAVASMGYRVMQVGCDPKADSTCNLLNGKELQSVMAYLREHDHDCEPTLEDIMQQGFGGVFCVEAGGPTPGIGCAGRGIITTFQTLQDLEAYEICKPDFVFYDILGDVVCGGFAAPIRDGYADEVIVITSGEKMALFAADNIVKAVRNFEDRDYARVRGIILNCRNVDDEEEIVRKFAEERNLSILGIVPRDRNVQKYENMNQTVIQGDPDLEISKVIMEIARSIVEGA